MWYHIFAVPCNSIPECADGSDEAYCDYSLWVLPAILAGIFFILFWSFFFYLYGIYCTLTNSILELRRNKYCPNQSDNDKMYRIAILAYREDRDAVRDFYNNEKAIHGDDSKTMCYLKVNMTMI